MSKRGLLKRALELKKSGATVSGDLGLTFVEHGVIYTFKNSQDRLSLIPAENLLDDILSRFGLVRFSKMAQFLGGKELIRSNDE